MISPARPSSEMSLNAFACVQSRTENRISADAWSDGAAHAGRPLRRPAFRDQLPGQPVFRKRFALEDRPHLAVAHHGDALAMFDEVAEPVRHQKDDAASGCDLVHFTKEFV